MSDTKVEALWQKAKSEKQKKNTSKFITNWKKKQICNEQTCFMQLPG